MVREIRKNPSQRISVWVPEIQPIFSSPREHQNIVQVLFTVIPVGCSYTVRFGVLEIGFWESPALISYLD